VTDVDYGGKSKCEIAEHHEEGSVGGFMRVSGKVSFDRTENTKAKGGFCAIQGKCSSTVDLRDYSGLILTLRARTRKQAFTFNLKPSSLFEGDIYQVKCEIAPSGQQWKDINIPFSRFHLTAQGVEREYQRSNDSLRVELLGFLFTLKTELKPFYELIGRAGSDDIAKRIFDTKAKRWGLIISPLGYSLVDILNKESTYLSVLNDAANSIVVSQIYIKINKSQKTVNYTVKEFSSSAFKFEYNANAGQPGLKKISFKMDKKAMK
jgi:hypothetical protein